MVQEGQRAKSWLQEHHYGLEKEPVSSARWTSPRDELELWGGSVPLDTIPLLQAFSLSEGKFREIGPILKKPRVSGEEVSKSLFV